MCQNKNHGFALLSLGGVETRFTCKRQECFYGSCNLKNKIKHTVVTLHAHARTQAGMRRFIAVNPGRPHARVSHEPWKTLIRKNVLKETLSGRDLSLYSCSPSLSLCLSLTHTLNGVSIPNKVEV